MLLFHISRLPDKVKHTWFDAVIQEPGVDIVLDRTGELESCLATALTKAQLTKLANLTAVGDMEQLQKIRELCAMWNMDLMLHGMAQVSCNTVVIHLQWHCRTEASILAGCMECSVCQPLPFLVCCVNPHCICLRNWSCWTPEELSFKPK